jgi:hypothetical protein
MRRKDWFIRSRNTPCPARCLTGPGSSKTVRLRRLYLPGLFIVAAVIAFSNVLTTWFLSDDFAQIGKVLSGDYSVVWGQAHGGFFRPLFILSYIVDIRIWGARPFGFHLTNVTVHALNSFLVFLLASGLLDGLNLDRRAQKTISISAAALFLLHPSHTEAVTWISGRADLFATFFGLSSVVSFIGGSTHGRKPLPMAVADLHSLNYQMASNRRRLPSIFRPLPLKVGDTVMPVATGEAANQHYFVEQQLGDK